MARRQRFRSSGLVWSGDDIFVLGMWRPPSFIEKLLSRIWGQGDRGDLQALVATQEGTRERLGGREAILLIACFNNMDVRATQCQTEPWDKFSRQEFAFSHLYLSFRI